MNIGMNLHDLPSEVLDEIRSFVPQSSSTSLRQVNRLERNRSRISTSESKEAFNHDRILVGMINARLRHILANSQERLRMDDWMYSPFPDGGRFLYFDRILISIPQEGSPHSSLTHVQEAMRRRGSMPRWFSDRIREYRTLELDEPTANGIIDAIRGSGWDVPCKLIYVSHAGGTLVLKVEKLKPLPNRAPNYGVWGPPGATGPGVY